MAGRTTSSLTKKEEEMAHSLVAVENLVKENKVPVFTSLQSTANYINKLTRESSSERGMIITTYEGNRVSAISFIQYFFIYINMILRCIV